MEGQRGQTLPGWTVATVGVLVLMFFVLNYANVIRWQIRAQNAADAAAAAALSPQVTQWNQTAMLLHASAVEEYRLRRLMDGMLLAIRGSGGCSGSSCAAAYAEMRTRYAASVRRYTTEVQLMQRIATHGVAEFSNDAQQIVTALGNKTLCGTVQGGDCSFAYNLLDFSPRTTSLANVGMDAGGYYIGAGTTANVKPDLNPSQLEVAVCHVVPPLIAFNFAGISFPTFKAIGRAAATSIMVTQEWQQSGSLTNPTTGQVYQPPEITTSVSSKWYDVDYSGNAWTSLYPAYNGYRSTITQGEFDSNTGWWSSIPLKPYKGTIPESQITCL